MKKITNKWPIWFVDPNTGDVLELDLRTATFTSRKPGRESTTR